MTDTRPTDQEFLEYTVKALVDNPADVKVERKID
ncbi:MAG TPA: RNA-binding protein, partial [Candidatus Moranbacteria bacterium]|nr:RNA-binding protein [Candidatus Moranbacteria bacterium]